MEFFFEKRDGVLFRQEQSILSKEGFPTIERRSIHSSPYWGTKDGRRLESVCISSVVFLGALKSVICRFLLLNYFAAIASLSRAFQDVPSDIVTEVDGVTFSLHKFPLVSESGQIRKLVTELRHTDQPMTELFNLPGGTKAFELVAEVCDGVNFEITTANVAHLCCISEYLEMTEEYTKNNLHSRAEEYLNSVVCKSLELCVEVLKQSKNLLPFADDMKIVPKCIDAIASKTCVEQIASSFSRLEYSSS